MSELLKLLTDMVGDKIPTAALVRLLPVLLPVAADLADGDARLSPENRLKIQEAIEGLKGELL